MKKLQDLNLQEMYELKSIIKSVIDDYEFQMEMYQKLNNLSSFERQSQDKNFVALCDKRKKLQNYANVLGVRIENEIHQVFETT